MMRALLVATLTSFVLAQAKAESVAQLGDCSPSKGSYGAEEPRARKEAEKANLKNGEVLARLIFSEALSSGYWRGHCNANSPESLFVTIGWGIMHRVREIGTDGYYGAIFAKNQFRTSFSSAKKPIQGYSGSVVNPFAVSFLCPLKAQDYLNRTPKKGSAAELYKEAQEVAGRIVRTYAEEGIPTPYRGITNFFYPKSEFFGEMRPAWAKSSDPEKNKGYVNLLKVSNPCVEFYRL